MGLTARVLRFALSGSTRWDPGRIVEVAGPTADASIPRLHHTFVIDELVEDDQTNRPAGLADLQAAVVMVASGEARSVVLSGFPDTLTLIRLGRELATDGVAIEPLIRRGGGGFDIRVHRLAATDP